MDFEHDVRRALRRRTAPDGFAQRVVARLQPAGNSRSPRPQARLHWSYWVAAAASVALVAFGGAEYYTHRQAVAKAERARRDIVLALQITADKFALVKQRLDEYGKERVEDIK